MLSPWFQKVVRNAKPEDIAVKTSTKLSHLLVPRSSTFSHHLGHLFIKQKDRLCTRSPMFTCLLLSFPHLRRASSASWQPRNCVGSGVFPQLWKKSAPLSFSFMDTWGLALKNFLIKSCFKVCYQRYTFWLVYFWQCTCVYNRPHSHASPPTSPTS